MNHKLRNIADFLASTGCPWGFCGGWAVDLFLGRVTREHEDVDVAVFRADQQKIRTQLARQDWSLQKVGDGTPVAWVADEIVRLPAHEIWCRNSLFDPPKFEMLLNESTEAHFIFRRDASVTMPLARAIVRSGSGLPVLAPEIVLLYKSNNAGLFGNSSDLHNALGALDAAARRWLADALRKTRPEHPWLQVIGAA